MGADVQDNRMGGGECADVWENFQGGRAGSPPPWIRDVDGAPQNWQDSGEFPSHCGKPSDGSSASEVYIWNMVVPPLTGGGNERVQVGRGGNINHMEAEYGHTIHCSAANSGHMRG